MARIWSTGFELNTKSTGVEVDNFSAAGAIVTTTVRSGTYAARINLTGTSGTIQVRKNLFSSDQNTKGWARLYINITSNPNANTEILRWVNAAGTTNAARIRLTTGGALVLLTSTSTTIATSSALNTGQWYRVEIMNDATTNPGTLEMKLDGVTVGTSGANTVQGSWARVDVGALSSITNCDYYIDDVAVNDDSGTFQNGYPGDGKIIHLHPNAAGDSTQWAISGAAGTNYGSVNETPPDDATTNVNTGTNGDTDLYNCDDSGINSYDTVNVVAVGGRFRNDVADATTAFKFEIEKTASGTLAQSLAIVPNSTTWRSFSTASPFVYPLTMYQDPDSSAWTQSTLDSMQIGVTITAANVNKIQLTNIWALVDYTPGTPPPPTTNTGSTLMMMGVG